MAVAPAGMGLDRNGWEDLPKGKRKSRERHVKSCLPEVELEVKLSLSYERCALHSLLSRHLIF